MSPAVRNLPRLSERKRIFNAEFRRAKKVVRQRSGGRCEIRWDENCTIAATDTHHVKGRVGPDVNDPEWLLDSCSSCHQTAEANPVEARARGVMVSRLGEIRPRAVRSSVARPTLSSVTSTPPEARDARHASPVRPGGEFPRARYSTRDGVA